MLKRKREISHHNWCFDDIKASMCFDMWGKGTFSDAYGTQGIQKKYKGRTTDLKPCIPVFIKINDRLSDGKLIRLRDVNFAGHILCQFLQV